MRALLIILTVFSSRVAIADWEIRGSAGPYLQDLKVPPSTVTQSEKSGFELELNLENKLNSRWKFRSDLFFRNDFVARDSVEQFQLIPRNFYFQRRQKNFTFKAGLQTLSLDGPDLVNPADVVHSKNWIDPVSPLTMGSAGLSLAYEKGDWNWEAFYVPVQTAPVLPGEHSPWLPRENRLPIESEDTEMRIPKNVRYEYLDPTELDNARNHNVTLKIQRKTENLEAQLLYYNGLATSPFLLTRITGTLISVNPDVIAVNSPVKLEPLYYRHHAVAGTFNIPFESWALHGGFNWLSPQGTDSRIPEETSLFTAGFEKSFSTSFGFITVIADYVRQERQDENQISFLRSIFEEAITMGVRIPYGEETQFFAGGLYDLAGDSSVYRIGFTHRLGRGWTMEGSAQFLQGPDETLIGLYDSYDSYSLGFRYNW